MGRYEEYSSENEEIEEASSAAFEALREHAQGNSATINISSSLLGKLNADATGNFSISPYSDYLEDTWFLSRSASLSAIRVNFKSTMEGTNRLKKQIVYHLIPQFHPFGTVRSFESTFTYSEAHRYLEIHLFEPNHLTASPDGIAAISSRLLNEALDRARDSKGNRDYWFLFFYITFWIALSEQGLIEKDLRLNVALREIDTTERHRDIQNTVKTERIGWRPFSEGELARMLEYAFLWTGEAIDIIQDAQDYIMRAGLLGAKYIPSGDRIEFEKVFGRACNNIRIINYSYFDVGYIKKNGEKRIGGQASWIYPLTIAVDRVRNGIFILVSLLVGLRKKELALIMFDDVIKDGAGEWHINITRFKTSADPNYFGDQDIVPIPTFIGEIIERYKSLREFDGNLRNGYLFQPISNPKKLNFADFMITSAAQAIGAEVGVDDFHIHRFRKTIAEILINRSERNLDLVRILFGHKTYTMSLRYIARNPYLVNSVIETLEESYTSEFAEIVTAVRSGKFSGAAAERIASVVNKRPASFTGKLLRQTIFDYIRYLIDSGEPIFIHRTSLSTFCVSSDSYSEDNPPPCLKGKKVLPEQLIPDPTNCQLECKNVVVLESSRQALEADIKFYESLLSSTSALKQKVKAHYKNKIINAKYHLDSLDRRNNASKSDKIQLREVT